MDQETTPVAPAAEAAATQAPRTSTWGKVQVKPKQAPEPKPQAAPKRPTAAKPATERKPATEPKAAIEPATAPEGGSDPSTVGTAAPRRRRSRGGRGRGGASRANADASSPPTDEAPAPSAGPEGGDGSSRPNEPKPRQQPKPKAPAARTTTGETDAAPVTGGEAPPSSNGEGQAATGPKKRRRRGGRGRGGRKPASTTAGDEDGLAGETEATQRDDATPDTTGNDAPRRRAGQRGNGAEPATKRPPKPKTLEEQVAAGGPTRGIRNTRSRTGRDGRRRREPSAPPPRITDKLMVITEHGERDQIAVLEEDVLVQHYVTRAGATSMVGNVYLGRVQNVLPGMEAAFVDVGRGRNGVLYAGEVNYSPEDIEGPAPRIEQLLKPGQAVMVQVTKDPMGGKGARLTANLSLAGRYIVLAPNQNLQGISRRLGDDARKRLKAMLKRVKPPEHGVIVRTAAEGATEEALETDLRRLLDIWGDIQAKAKKGKAPTGLYEEPELTVRVVRDLFTDEEYRGLVTDSQRVYDKIHGYLQEVAPDLATKITMHTGPLPAFEEHRVVEQIHKALDKKVWLPSGGYLFIERTEAMTIVDVNTGKSVGKTNLEETVVNTNLEAAREVARQLRLRDIGGIIVIDFIDMLLDKNKKGVEDTMRDALAIDKTRSQVFEIGPLGLMQVTRKRVSSGLVESFSETCPTCEGRGILLNYDVN